MTASHKVSVSLLISVLLFAAFSVLAFTGLFDLIEARFYNPSITKQALHEITTDASLVDAYIKEVQGRFSQILTEPAVQRSFLPNQSAEDIFERSKATGILLESTGGLQWIRFIDAGGKRIHFSTLREDILRQDATSLAYKNYGDNPQDPPFDLINIPDKENPRIIGDANQERLLFCFPFYDSFSVYRGTAVFSLSVRSVTERVIREGRLRIGEEVSLVADPLGFVTGLPRSGKTVLMSTISSSWKEGILGPVPLSSDNGSRFALLSVRTDSGLIVGRILDDRLFVFPLAMKIILLASFFLTSFLIIFLFFNLEQDTTTVVRERLKRLQISLLEEYYEKKEAIDWNRWAREMEQRREAVKKELKRGLGRKPKKKLEQDIDNLIDKSWDEIIALLGGKVPSQVTATFDESKLQELLNRVLSTVSALPAGNAAAGTTGAAKAAAASRVAGAVGAAGTAGTAGHPGSAGAAGLAAAPRTAGAGVATSAVLAAEVSEAEELSELEGVEALEEVAEAEELTEAEELAEVEELPEAEALEEIIEAEEVPDAEEVTEAAAAAEVSEAEELSELEEVEALEEEDIIPGLEDIKKYQKNANIRIVFGEDDIPTIIETSGLELVDSDEASVLAILDRKGASELEELEPVAEESELEGAEQEEAEQKVPESEEPPKTKPVDTEALIDQIAREIEFSPFPETAETSGAGLTEMNFEIVSPFETLLSQLKHESEPGLETGLQDQEEELAAIPKMSEENPQNISDIEILAELEEIPADTDSEKAVVAELETIRPSSTQIIMYKPFGQGADSEPAALEEVAEDEPEEIQEVEELINLDETAVIEDDNGLLYIATTVYQEAGKNTKDLNPDLRNLIDSVLSSAKRD
ncbi:MAG: hypothetical protein LDL24_03355 [Treponema sp.]|nr:hypothetical protein [Treponema sp.]